MKLKLLFFSFLLYVVGCSPDDSDTPLPSVNPKEKFIADWICTETSRRDGQAQPFQVHIVDGSGDTVLMENCYAVGFNKKAKLVVSGDNIRFAPNNQQISSGLFLKRNIFLGNLL